MIRRSVLIRKCVVVSVVLIVTCVSLILKGQSNSEPTEKCNHYISRKLQSHASHNISIYNNSESRISTETLQHSYNKSKNNKKDDHKQDHKAIPTAHPKKKPSVLIPLLNKGELECITPAANEFPKDVFRHWKGAIFLHILVVLYMFYCLAIVCDHYFMPALEECAQRLNLSEDVAGATFMAAGSSAPELFIAILGVFVAKGDVGTGTIVGSAVFNILFVIGLCSLYTTSIELNWWPVARDTAYYTFTVLVLIAFIYDGQVSSIESCILLLLYIVYILIMNNNIKLRDYVQQRCAAYGIHPGEEFENLKAEAAAIQYHSFKGMEDDYGCGRKASQPSGPRMSLYEAANIVIIKHKRLFRPITRFRSAANLIIIQRVKANALRKQYFQQEDYVNFGKSFESMRKVSTLPDEEVWKRVPDPNIEGWKVFAKWAVIAPIHAVLFFTIPSCKVKQKWFLVTFFMSILWTAIFSYIMVWMVTLIGYSLDIPDSIMGITLLAAGTSVPDAYASIHVAKQGQADMAVSNSIGSNVFDILVGLALPWFVETAIVKPGSLSYINSRGLVYAVILLFISLMITIYMFHRHHWTLNPRLGTALLITYGLFLIFSSMIEFNLLGNVNPPMCVT